MPDLVIHHPEGSEHGPLQEDTVVHPKTNLNSYNAVDVIYAQEADVQPDPGDGCYNHLVLHEDNHVRTIWTTVMFVALVYTGTIFLYNFCFLTFHIDKQNQVVELVKRPVWDIFDNIVDVAFWVDLFANFFFSFKDGRGVEVDSMRSIAVNYMSGLFWVNLLACVPDIITQFIDLRALRLARLQRMSRLTRLMRLSRLVKLVSMSQDGSGPIAKRLKNSRYIRLVNFMSGLILSVHILACGLYLVASLHETYCCPGMEDDAADPRRGKTWVSVREIQGASPFEQWLTAMYFVLTVFTTVGFGDISPKTVAEVVYVSFVMLLGCVVHSIIISEVIQAVTSTDKVQALADQMLTLIDAFSAHCQLPWDAQEAMRQEIKYRVSDLVTASQINPGEMRELLTGKQLPRWLLGKLPEQVFQGKLRKNKVLNSFGYYMPPRLPSLMAVHLQSNAFDAGEIVYQMHDFPFNLFIILSGTYAHVGMPRENLGGLDMIQQQQNHGGESVDLRVQQKIARSRRKIDQTSSGQIVVPHGPPPGGLYPYRLLTWGSYFGDIEMIKGTPRVSTVRCEAGGECLVLHKHNYSALRSEFPQFGALWNYAARRFEWSRRKQLEKLRVGLTYQVLAAVLIQRQYRIYRRRGEVAPVTPEVKDEVALAAFKNRIAREAGRIAETKDGAITYEEMKDMRNRIGKLDAKVDLLRIELSQLIRVMADPPRSGFFRSPLATCTSK